MVPIPFPVKSKIKSQQVESEEIESLLLESAISPNKRAMLLFEPAMLSFEPVILPNKLAMLSFEPAMLLFEPAMLLKVATTDRFDSASGPRRR